MQFTTLTMKAFTLHGGLLWRLGFELWVCPGKNVWITLINQNGSKTVMSILSLVHTVQGSTVFYIMYIYRLHLKLAH